MRNLLSLLNRFRGDRRGNIAVIFTLALVPVLSSIGCAVDYSRASMLRSKLLAASDAASCRCWRRQTSGDLVDAAKETPVVGVNQPGRHGGALLAGLLAEHGVRHVFGVPGGQTLAERRRSHA